MKTDGSHGLGEAAQVRSPLAPAYYLGRPAQVWTDTLQRRHRMDPTEHRVPAAAARMRSGGR
jgi:hypothetical protein